MWKALAKHAQNMLKLELSAYEHWNDHFSKHAHLPRSIWAARVFWLGLWTGFVVRICCSWTSGGSALTSVPVDGLHWVIMVTISMAFIYALAIYLRICGSLALISRTRLISPWSPS
ncbi:hypothetical protein EDD17DRAFT_1649573 [Pisolithus thermaeus]|nr:hypothetical protein EDD17DRAFT_1649573 [Pisolithus thermaeus]